MECKDLCPGQEVFFVGLAIVEQRPMLLVQGFLAHFILKSLATLTGFTVTDDHVGFRVAVNRAVWIWTEVAC
jgi:hypothetical protein